MPTLDKRPKTLDTVEEATVRELQEQLFVLTSDKTRLENTVQMLARQNEKLQAQVDKLIDLASTLSERQF